MYYAYVLRSGIDGRLYKGMTQNIEARLKEHNAGKVSSARGYRPWRLIYLEECTTRSEARVREKFLKSGIGREFLQSKGY